MKSIRHIALYTNDIQQLSEFYKTYFLALKEAVPDDTGNARKICFLRFDSETKMELIQVPRLAEREKIRRVGFAHLAFSVGGEAEVDSTTAELVKGGATLIRPPLKGEDGAYTSCVTDPDGNEIEIVE